MNTLDILITLALSLVMFGIGSSLKFRDFKTMFKEKKPFLVGLSFQMVFLPLFALAIAVLSDLPPVLKAGLFIVSICPGGSTSNFISYLVNADTALSIALTTVNSFIILVTLPLLSNFAVEFFLQDTTDISISPWKTLTQVFFSLLLPAFLGIVFNEKFPKTSESIQRPLKIINSLLLALVYGLKFFAGESSGGSGITNGDIAMLLPYCLLMHLGAMLISYVASRMIKIPNLKATTIGIEVGLQNTALSILVAGTMIGNNEMTKPALVFAIFSFFTTFAFAFLAMRKKAQS